MATPNKVTLLDLVQTVSDCATSDDEIVATVASLINSGRVLLCGTFAGARLDLADTPLSTFGRKLLPLATKNRFRGCLTR